MKKYFHFLAYCVFIVSCKSRSQNSGIINIELTGKDTCFLIKNEKNDTINVFRELLIIENTANDTAVVGFGVVPPGYTGKIPYLQIDRRTDALLDPEIDIKYQSKTNIICINFYKATSGTLKIKYYY